MTNPLRFLTRGCALAGLLFTLAGCADVDWQRTAKTSVESACRSAGNCRVACDTRTAATINDAQCGDPGRKRPAY